VTMVQYRRTERHRQSLVYQKRYLLLLLAGFQDAELQTLGAIARMGAHPSSSSSASLRMTGRSGGQLVQSRRRSALRRFRVVARVVTAVRRSERYTATS